MRHAHDVLQHAAPHTRLHPPARLLVSARTGIRSASCSTQHVSALDESMSNGCTRRDSRPPQPRLALEHRILLQGSTPLWWFASQAHVKHRERSRAHHGSIHLPHSIAESIQSMQVQSDTSLIHTLRKQSAAHARRAHAAQQPNSHSIQLCLHLTARR